MQPPHRRMLVHMGTETKTEAFQIPLEAAEAYEEKFVPALFAEWAPHLIAASGLSTGQSLLDVACGTGIVARTATDRLGSGSRIVGVDLNDAMLTVARRVRPELEWMQGNAADLPVEDGSFDVVACQFALMFFPDRGGAISEMARAVTGGGAVAVSVPAALAAQSAYQRIVEVVNHHAGAEATALFDTYWSCGDLGYLKDLFADAALTIETTRTFATTAHYPSIDAAIATELDSTPLGELVSAEIVERIRADVYDALQPYVAESGGVGVPLTGHVVVGRRPLE
jgi:SAM-dependent methyltransferase